MSIHAKSSQEAQGRLAAQRRNSTIMSAVIAFLAIAVIGLVLGLFLLPNLITEAPAIVTYQANEPKDTTAEPERVKSAIQRKPTSPSATMTRVIASATSSAVSIPVPDVAVDIQSVDFGDNDDFGGGWGYGIESGKGGGASFFNQKVSAQRIAYVIDYSQSMSGEKDQLMRAELSKSISGLKPGVSYQMIFFAGPAWVAGSEVKGKTVTGKDGKKFEWKGIGSFIWSPLGKRQQAEWLDMTPRRMGESLEIIQNTKLWGGTVWDNPLEMAFDMDPPPQIVFFMTDGATGGDMMKLTDDLAAKARAKGIKVNCVALMEPQAEKPMFNLAEKTGGVFTIVETGGKVREVRSIKEKDRKKKK